MMASSSKTPVIHETIIEREDLNVQKVCERRVVDDIDNIDCEICARSFSSRCNLNRHLRDIHNIALPVKKLNFLCPVCCISHSNKQDFESHLQSRHDILLVEEEHHFQDFTGFLRWKEEIEKETGSFYAKEAGKKRTGDGFKEFFRCNRSGRYESIASKRNERIQGTRKIGGFCPASMKVFVIEKGRTTVKFCSTHVGHQIQLKHLNVPKSNRLKIAAQLRAGISRNEVLRRLRQRGFQSDITREGLITGKDLRNIAQLFQIDNQERRHSDDMTSVDAIIKEFQESENDPVILYENSSTPGQPSDNLMIGLMNEGQAEMLKKYGEKCILIDSTHGTSKYKIQLTTIMVVDSEGCGFPCCFLFSSKIDIVAFKKFFKALKEKIGVIQTRAFMSDDYPAYFAAWSSVMGQPNNKLLCSWHVLNAWKINLNTLPSEHREEVKEKLRELLSELDENDFNRELDKFLSFLLKRSLKEFHEYFRSTYANRPKQWAYCYRKNLGINTNNHLEAMHRKLKHKYMNGKKVRRLDKSIYCLMELTTDAHIDRMIALEKGKISNKMTVIRQRHAHSLKMAVTKVPSEDGNEFYVQSESQKEIKIYTIKRKSWDPCACKLKCSSCNACVHTYSCNCVDYLIKNNLCKHIHYVLLGKSEFIDSRPVEPSDLIVEEDTEKTDEISFHFSQIKQSQESGNLEEKKCELIRELNTFIASIETFDEDQVKFVGQELGRMRNTCLSMNSSHSFSVLEVEDPSDRKRNLTKQIRF